MANRFLNPIQISASGATPTIDDQAAFLNLLREIDTALASMSGLHVAEFAAEHGIPESDVLQNLKVLDAIGYPHTGTTRVNRHVLHYPRGQRRLFLAPLMRAPVPAAELKTVPETGERLCEECGKPFTSRFSIAVTCSAECSQLRASRQMREKYDRRKKS